MVKEVLFLDLIVCLFIFYSEIIFSYAVYYENKIIYKYQKSIVNYSFLNNRWAQTGKGLLFSSTSNIFIKIINKIVVNYN